MTVTLRPAASAGHSHHTVAVALAAAALGRPHTSLPLPLQRRTLGEERGENPDAHADPNREIPPRPLGVDPTMPWAPRNPTRDYTENNIIVRMVEFLEGKGWIQSLGAALVRMYAKVVASDNGTPGAPAADEPGSWTFAGVGDYGAGTKQQARVAANMLASAPEVVVTTGDNVYPSGRWQDYQKNFDPPHLYGELVKKTRFMPALGNHDLYRDDLRPYFEHFPHLKGRPYYDFAHKNVQFVALDTDQDVRPGSAQYRWLEGVLKNTKLPWKVVYFHYPLFGKNDEEFKELRESLQPLFEKYGVQLVLSGHDHTYQRSKPVNGVTHVLTGGGGQQVWAYPVKRHEHDAYRAAQYHHVEVSVGASKMVVRAVNERGAVIDTTVIPVGAVRDAARGAALANAAQHSKRNQARRRPAAPAHAA